MSRAATFPGPNTFNSRPRPSAIRVSHRTVSGSELNIRTTARSHRPSLAVSDSSSCTVRVRVTKSSSTAVFLRVFWRDAAENRDLRLRYSNRRADSARGLS